ncbi:unnamed protein product [Urochloa decumbens]|uniref:non-specific serine/threonine protein kinase n=1 Tax=Urochloa decumbens TaxID=240449 RepID=A0ABC8WLE5_9POAL
MLSWLRRFPHDVMQRKENGGSGRRTSSSTTWRNKGNNSFTARIIRCASSVVDATTSRRRMQEDDDRLASSPPPRHSSDDADEDENDYKSKSNSQHNKVGVVSAKAFSFRELAEAAGSFRQEHLIGEGGFGRVYKARLQQAEQQVVVAVKQLDRNGFQGNGEFVVEVLMLSMLHHPNLVNLIGYCAEGEQRLLVYEYMALGSLEDHLLLPMRARGVLPWRTRMRIAHGAAQGLEYLHDRGVIYRDLKSSNILLHQDYSPRLSDFGLAKLLPPASSSSSSNNSSTNRVMGTYGYCAPEYLRTGKLSAKSDVYSFGVLLLELITGRRAIDATRPDGEQSLVGWAAAYMFAVDPTRLHHLVDPRLVISMQSPPASELKQAVGVAAMCLQEHHAVRPEMTDVVMALSFLAAAKDDDHPN